MPVVPISGLGAGAEWSVGGVGGLDDAKIAEGVDRGASSGSGFGDMLTKQLSSLESTQVDAADAARSLADGTAADVSAAVVAVERAQLAMQLASQLRTKGVEAINDVFHTQV
jgi:flagellar hook-basal body complex protein FliE